MKNITEKNIYLKSECDDLEISVTIFIPTSDPKGIVQISHGMTEHKKRYYKFMNFLANEGYIAIINDHRGHGESVKNSDDLGYFYDNTASYIVDDLHQVTKFIKEQYPSLPLYLFGHSMGSMVATEYLKKYDRDIDKLIVCGLPGQNRLASIGLLLTKIISSIKGDKYRSQLLHNLSFRQFNKKIKNSTSPNDWICTNKEVINEYNNDALSGYIFTTNGFNNLFQLNINIYNKNNWALNNLTLPIFYIAGSDDPVIISKRKWYKAQQFMKDLGYINIQNKLYPKLRHELLNEVNNIIVYEDILKFIQE